MLNVNVDDLFQKLIAWLYKLVSGRIVGLFIFLFTWDKVPNTLTESEGVNTKEF